jgi:hypothetical protein
MTLPPKNIRTGLIRIYLLIAIPWILWFSYQTYTSYILYCNWRDWGTTHLHKLEDIRNNQNEKKVDELLEKYLGDSTEDLFYEAINLRDRYKHKINDSLMALPLIPCGLPILAFAYFWVVDGFKRKS